HAAVPIDPRGDQTEAAERKDRRTAVESRLVTAPTVGSTIPEGRAATSPPEERGLSRDDVKLLVASPGRVTHTTFRYLGEHLAPGDVVVVNTSATRPAAIRSEERRVGKECRSRGRTDAGNT